jgi:hypothetical protein
MQDSRPIIIKTHWIMKVVAALGIIMFGGFAIIGLLNHEEISIVGMSFLFALGGIILWLLANSFIEMSNEKILVSVPYGRYQIRWDEINLIETNEKLYAFIGEDKRLVISLTFANKSSRDALELLEIQCKERNVEIKKSLSVPRTHLNTKI